VIYGVDIVCDILLGVWILNEEYIFAKFIMLLIVYGIIMVIHIQFQLYRLKSLNVLDEVILLALLLLLISSLDGNSWQISPTFWILLFLNYLSCSTKIQHVVVLISVCSLILLLNFACWTTPNSDLWATTKNRNCLFPVSISVSVLSCRIYFLYDDEFNKKIVSHTIQRLLY